MNLTIKAALMLIFVSFVFGTSLVNAGHGRHGYSRFCQGDFIAMLGVFALTGLMVTLFMAYKKSGNRNGTLIWHKNIAIITIGIATLHAILALFFH